MVTCIKRDRYVCIVILKDSIKINENSMRKIKDFIREDGKLLVKLLLNAHSSTQRVTFQLLR